MRIEDQGITADWTPIELVAFHLTEKLLNELRALSPSEVEGALCEIGCILDTGELTADQEKFAADALGNRIAQLDQERARLESELDALDGVTS